MWTYGECFGFSWQAKVYTNPSMWGIADGRISKLWIYDSKEQEVYCYDRGPSGGDSISAEDLRKVLEAIDQEWDFSEVGPAVEEIEVE